MAPGGAGSTPGAGAPEAGLDDGRPPVDPSWTADATKLTDEWAKLSTSLEEGAIEEFKETAFDEVREEYEKYFEALDVHPRQLVGQTVPKIGDENGGEEVLRDSRDAEEWQAAVKQILTNEVRDRATRLLDDAAPAIDSLHQSIEIFKQNPDMIPGTKQFDRELADRFATLAKPYEIRVEGKLRGYQIPTQPLIAQIRAQLVADRQSRGVSAAATTAAASPAATPAAGRSTAQADQPQAGIPSRAGTGEGKEDFSALFGTIGLPQLRI